MTTCRSCGASIVWAKTSAGASSPYDADPSPEGTWRLTTLQGTLRAVYAGKDAQPNEALHQSHFATCPDADEHRRAS